MTETPSPPLFLSLSLDNIYQNHYPRPLPTPDRFSLPPKRSARKLNLLLLLQHKRKDFNPSPFLSLHRSLLSTTKTPKKGTRGSYCVRRWDDTFACSFFVSSPILGETTYNFLCLDHLIYEPSFYQRKVSHLLIEISAIILRVYDTLAFCPVAIKGQPCLPNMSRLM